MPVPQASATTAAHSLIPASTITAARRLLALLAEAALLHPGDPEGENPSAKVMDRQLQILLPLLYARDTTEAALTARNAFLVAELERVQAAAAAERQLQRMTANDAIITSQGVDLWTLKAKVTYLQNEVTHLRNVIKGQPAAHPAPVLPDAPPRQKLPSPQDWVVLEGSLSAGGRLR